MKKILILGGGYAGVTCAARLRGIDAEVTLVNDHSYHHLTTLLHQPVVGRRSFRQLSVKLLDVLRPPVRIHRARVLNIIPADRKVIVQSREGEFALTYEIVVVALGWEPQFFHIPGLEENAFTLRNLPSSRLAKDKIEESLIAFDANPAERWRTSIVIGGGGLTGVELAGELADARNGFAKSFDLPADKLTITLIDAVPTLLHGLDPRLGQAATKLLQDRNVQIHTDTAIARVDIDKVVFKDGTELPAGVVIWTGGVRGNRVLEESGFAVNKQGRAIVDGFLHPDGHAEIFIVGDCAQGCDSSGQPLPPTAQLAVQQGEYAAAAIRSECNGIRPKKYESTMKGIILSVGRRQALGLVGGRFLQGKTAGLLKDMIAYRYLYKIGGLSLSLRKFVGWMPYLADLHRD